MSGHGSSSARVVVAALVGNSLIAISKFAAATVTGSVATFAEGVHSLADSANQVLLLLGLKRARRPANALHPFGHAIEAYFWPFLVSIIIFSVGGLYALYEGIHKLIHPGDSAGTDPFWSYVVLGLALVFEGYSLFVAQREFNRTRKGRRFIDALFGGKDPTIAVVLMEDSAAMLGLVVALVAVLLSDVTGQTIWDGIGSSLIGVLLCTVAVFLATDTHSLLVGEAISDTDRGTIMRISTARADVEAVTQLLSMHLGPSEVILAMKLAFRRTMQVDEVETAINALEQQIRSALPQMRFVFIEPDTNYDAAQDVERSSWAKGQSP